MELKEQNFKQLKSIRLHGSDNVIWELEAIEIHPDVIIRFLNLGWGKQGNEGIFFFK